ncbi:MAG: hypothetical protein AAF614_33835 [Chloroflexota bacterium]
MVRYYWLGCIVQDVVGMGAFFKKLFLLSITILFFVTACGLTDTALPTPVPTETQTEPVQAPTTALEPTVVVPTDVVEPTNEAADTPTSAPEPTETAVLPDAGEPTPTETAILPDLSLTPEDVSLFPVPEIFAGDLVTFQVQPFVAKGINARDVTIHILVNGFDVVEGHLNARNFAGDAKGVFEWAWNTTDLVGEHEVRVVLDRDDTIQVGDEDPTNNQVSFTVLVRDRGDLPPDEQNATWVTAETSCCTIHTISGTAAYRDLPELSAAVETAVSTAAARLNETPDRKINIYFVERVIGQGGYAGSAIVVSYLDRQYAGNGLNELLVHEAAHIIDQQFAPHRLQFLAEGLAVWTANGHYKNEDLVQRNAALLTIDRYVPLDEVVNDFYPVQHEIGYLQAAGFVTYLLDTYGWSTFKAFYSNTTFDDGATALEAIDRNLQIYYNETLADMEADWLAQLGALEVEETAVADLQTTIRFYDMMRRYQILYDPTAHFLRAWIPRPNAVKNQGNPADLTRHPQTELNITLETMFQAADAAWREGQYDRANIILNSIERVLDNDGAFIDPLATNYLNIVRKATDVGYDVQDITLEGTEAQLIVTLVNKDGLIPINMRLVNGDWIILAN